MKIELKKILKSDRDTVRMWRNLPEVAKYMYSFHEISAEEHAEWFHRTLRDKTKTYWKITLNGEGVGIANITGIEHEHSRCSWAFYLANPIVRGQGVGGYVEYFVLNHVFEKLKLNKLSCEVIDFNEAVVAMHKKYGFVEEGRLRQHIIRDGLPHDVICLSMLRDEWLGIKDRLRKKMAERGLSIG